ncbi:MAG: helix-turn-helix transcriptional regulator [Hyphomicrobiales bacterium]|nr:helix-turn-helix transcriptional regulator [Hyphomicrobiales bacterium]
MIFSEQIRAARALLGMNQSELATAASVGVATVRRIEGNPGKIRGGAETLWKIQKALETAGVVFLPADETGGPGVRLKADRSG